jgi:type II secretory pathway pseudopilin PulG
MLVELVVALFVLAVGVVAAVSLVTHASNTENQVGADVRAALFAQATLDGLRAGADREAARAAATGAWERFWVDVADGEYLLSVAAADLWANEDPTVVGGSLQKLVLTNYNPHTDEPTDIPGQALRYRLSVGFVTNSFGWTSRVDVAVTVWDGEFGRTNAQAGRRFYTEYRNWGNP